MRLTAPTDIRARLEVDRPWAAFSLADLDAPYAEFAAWFGSDGGSAVVLLYRAFDPPLVVCHGAPQGCDEAMDDVIAALGAGREAYVSARPELLPLVARRFGSFDQRPMVRMLLDVGRFRPAASSCVTRLGPHDLDDVRALYREEPPAFFLPAQLRDGVYFGVRERGGLVAIAGTHVVSTVASVGAIGNVYTRRDRRREGLALAVTSAVTAELLRIGVVTIVLNIVAANDTARRVYERIGFVEHCEYYEGLAAPVTGGRSGPRESRG